MTRILLTHAALANIDETGFASGQPCASCRLPLASIASAMHYPSMTNATTPERTIETLRTWKVRSSARGVELTINGRTFELGATSDALVFALQRATSGHQDADATGDIA